MNVSTIPFKGRKIPVADYSEIQRLFAVAFGCTDSSWPKREAEKVALDAAADALAAIRHRVRYAEARALRLGKKR